MVVAIFSYTCKLFGHQLEYNWGEPAPPSAEPTTVDAGASPCQQPVEEFLYEDRPQQSVNVDHQQVNQIEEKLVRSGSPHTEARKEQPESLGRQIDFIQDAVVGLYKVEKEMDWLNLTATKEMPSVKAELSNIAEAFRVLPQVMKQALSKLQQRQEQILLKEQSKLRVYEATVAALQISDSQLTRHDNKIDDMSLFIKALADKFSKFEKEQDNVLKLLQSIDHTVSKIENA
ncbi:hypothetical protein OROMI_007797 [Orobanche minor]